MSGVHTTLDFTKLALVQLLDDVNRQSGFYIDVYILAWQNPALALCESPVKYAYQII